MTDRQPIDSSRIAAGQQAALELTQTDAAFAAIRETLINALLNADEPAEILNLHGKLRGIEFVKAELKSKVLAGQAEQLLAVQDDD